MMAGCSQCKMHISETEDKICGRCARADKQRIADLEEAVRRLEATVLEMAKRCFGDGER